MINLIEKQIVLLDRSVQVSVCRTECGIQVLIAGGDRSHIGAVSIVDEKSNLISHVFEGHKDYVISDRWAVKLYERSFWDKFSCLRASLMVLLISTRIAV